VQPTPLVYYHRLGYVLVQILWSSSHVRIIPK
jgi:hypothetical protein